MGSLGGHAYSIPLTFFVDVHKIEHMQKTTHFTFKIEENEEDIRVCVPEDLCPSQVLMIISTLTEKLLNELHRASK